MTEHQKETAFLRQCLLYDDTPERHELEGSLTQLQRDERCVRRASWLMVVLAALAAIGLGYAAVLSSDYPDNTSRFMTQFITKLFGALGLASVISLVAFVGFWFVHRKQVDRRREECRRLATRVIESRLGKPSTVFVKGREA
jgi:hypothetical protein